MLPPPPGPRYTPSQARREARKLDTQARDQALQKAYRKLKRKRPGMSDVWYAQQIAKRTVAGGLSPETIRKKDEKVRKKVGRNFSAQLRHL